MSVDASLILEILKKMQAGMTRLEDGQEDIKERLGTVEATLAFHTGMFGTLSETSARQQVALDRIEKRITRIERRLDLVDEPKAGV